jgi:hypothetical protein
MSIVCQRSYTGSMTAYTIKVTTADVRGASTDAGENWLARVPRASKLFKTRAT